MKRLLAVVLLVAACGASVSNSPAALPTPTPTATTGPTVTAATQTPAPEPTSRPPATWSQVTASGDNPAAREDHTWTVDPATETAYIFGGRDGSSVFGDLFAFDLPTDTWRRMDPTGATPPARFGHEANWVPGVGLVIFAGQANA